MKRKQFKIINFLTTMVMAAAIGFSISIGNPAIAIASFIGGIAVVYLSKRRLEDIVEDERIRQVSQKASGITLQFIILSFAIGGTVLVAMKDTYPKYTDFGFFMSYAACTSLVLYSIFYMYFNMKSGG
ncbi:DUF2178 domain-containing protein [Methanosarcina sp. UBA5]|uniref:DUF2178 domain-containing protein n=1 Tax=Methanosarcina sp. UBA5 TaxID=1915593 RepID=UPI0025D75198|nr:DUF2178 domain-containing protein [Methanosarcina sp. UBA5]